MLLYIHLYSKAYNDFAEDMTCDMHNNFDED